MGLSLETLKFEFLQYKVYSNPVDLLFYFAAKNSQLNGYLLKIHQTYCQLNQNKSTQPDQNDLFLMRNQSLQLGRRYHSHVMTTINFVDFQSNFQIINLIILVFQTVFERIKTFYCAYPAFYNQIHKSTNLKNSWIPIPSYISLIKVVFNM